MQRNSEELQIIKEHNWASRSLVALAGIIVLYGIVSSLIGYRGLLSGPIITGAGILCLTIAMKVAKDATYKIQKSDLEFKKLFQNNRMKSLTVAGILLLGGAFLYLLKGFDFAEGYGSALVLGCAVLFVTSMLALYVLGRQRTAIIKKHGVRE